MSCCSVLVLPLSNGTVFPASTKVSLDNELVVFYRKPRSGCLLLKASVSASRESGLCLLDGHDFSYRSTPHWPQRTVVGQSQEKETHGPARPSDSRWATYFFSIWEKAGK